MSAPVCGTSIRLAGLALAAAAALAPAQAALVFESGNVQYTNVNIAAETLADSAVGDIGNTGLTMWFKDMIGPDGATPVQLHGQHGVAFVESGHDSATRPHTGFSSITLAAPTGYGFTAGDFKLDELDGLADGELTFMGVNAQGQHLSQVMAIKSNGQNAYNFRTTDGERITQLTFTSNRLTTGELALMQDIKQVSVEVAPLDSQVPEPATWVLVALAGIGATTARRGAAGAQRGTP